MKKYDVAIIGAGSGGLSARREVAKKTDNYLVIDDGPLGTTCARVGCMPSKVLIQVANDYYRRKKFEQEGILGGEKLSVDTKHVMKHVRSLRDRFVRGVTGGMSSWDQTHLLRKRAKFIGENELDCDGEIITADKIVIATGSSPMKPEMFRGYEDFLITTDQFFELDDLPKSVAVIGLGVIGLEIGQALHRLGVNVVGIGRREVLAGIVDPAINAYTVKKFKEEMNLLFGGVDSVEKIGNQLLIKSTGQGIKVDKVLMTTGRAPNWKSLGLEVLSKLELNHRGIPTHSNQTFKINGYDHLFIAGDNTGEKPILHEASDEGKIAGYNCVNPEMKFQTRTPLNISFTEPNIANVGMLIDELGAKSIPYEFGEVTFEGQGRSIVKLKEIGLLRVYGHRETGELLGAEMFSPDAEHIAHLLSWVIAQKLTVNTVLSFPFYHPVIEEGLRTCLRDLRDKVNEAVPVLETFPIKD